MQQATLQTQQAIKTPVQCIRFFVFMLLALVATSSYAVTDNVPDISSLEVSVVVTDPIASEDGNDTGTFTIGRTGDTTLPLVIRFGLSGTALPDVDYKIYGALGGSGSADSPFHQELSYEIPAGASSVAVEVIPIDDNNRIEPDETVVLTLFDPISLDAKPPVSITIINNADDPQAEIDISVVATDSTAFEAGADTGVFTITRTGSIKLPLEVRLSLSGTAHPDVDYKIIGALGGSACAGCPFHQQLSYLIPAGSSSVAVEIIPVDDDNRTEEDETVILTLFELTTGESGSRAVSKSTNARLIAKIIGSPSATITIINNAKVLAIPTLQQWALILLIMLLLLSGLYYSKLERNRW